MVYIDAVDGSDERYESGIALESTVRDGDAGNNLRCRWFFERPSLSMRRYDAIRPFGRIRLARVPSIERKRRREAKTVKKKKEKEEGNRKAQKRGGEDRGGKERRCVAEVIDIRIGEKKKGRRMEPSSGTAS